MINLSLADAILRNDTYKHYTYNAGRVGISEADAPWTAPSENFNKVMGALTEVRHLGF